MGGQVVYRGGVGAGTFTCGLSAGLLGMGVLGLLRPPAPSAAVVLPFVMAACFAYVGVRQFRVRLVVTDDEVELRGAVRTKTLPRSQVVDVEVGLFLNHPALFVVDSGRSRWMVPQELRMGPARSLEQRRAALLADLADPSHPPAPKPPCCALEHGRSLGGCGRDVHDGLRHGQPLREMVPDGAGRICAALGAHEPATRLDAVRVAG